MFHSAIASRKVSLLTIAPLLSGVIFWVGQSNAAIYPKWNDTNPVHVSIPAPGASATYHAMGSTFLGNFDVVLVFDASGSMAFNTQPIATAPNGGTQRGDWAVAGANALVDELPGEVRVGLTRFAGASDVVVALNLLNQMDPLSDHRSLLRDRITGMPRNGTTGTNIGNAISVATQVLTQSGSNSDSQHIVLITDGDETQGNARNAAASSIAMGIDSISTIGLPGITNGGLDLLRDVASLGKGKFVDGTNLVALIDQFKTILNQAETLSELDVFNINGDLVQTVPVNADGNFEIDLPIARGQNVFTARATSSLGNVKQSELVVVGVPETSTFILTSLVGISVFAFFVNRRCLV